MEYPKTENLYARDPETHRAGPEHGFRQEAVGQIARWLVTEKVDGMNMRVVWGGGSENGFPLLNIYGRTERAQIPGDLMAYMQETFTPEKLVDVFARHEDHPEYGPVEHLPGEVVLFGEGFGPGIQKAGQAYGGEKRFVLFDVVVDGHWLSFDNVKDVAQKLGVPTVPVLCSACTLEEAKDSVNESGLLPAGSEHIEGIVARTDPYLFDGRGRRVMFKYKVRDL